MIDVRIFLWTALTSLFRSRLEAEFLVLRQQINVLPRNSPKRSVFRPFDRLLFVGLCRLAPGVLDAPGHRPARNRGSLAPGWISIILALEIQAAQREIERPAGDPSADPGHDPGQPALGRAPPPRRTAHARHRRRPRERCKAHGPEEDRALSCNHTGGIASMRPTNGIAIAMAERLRWIALGRATTTAQLVTWSPFSSSGR